MPSSLMEIAGKEISTPLSIYEKYIPCISILKELVSLQFIQSSRSQVSCPLGEGGEKKKKAVLEKSDPASYLKIASPPPPLKAYQGKGKTNTSNLSYL